MIVTVPALRMVAVLSLMLTISTGREDREGGRRGFFHDCNECERNIPFRKHISVTVSRRKWARSKGNRQGSVCRKLIQYTLLYKFLTKSAVWSTLVYNKFANNKHESEWPHTANLLYNEKYIIGRLYRYFYIYFSILSAPTAETLFLLVLSMLANQNVSPVLQIW